MYMLCNVEQQFRSGLIEYFLIQLFFLWTQILIAGCAKLVPIQSIYSVHGKLSIRWDAVTRPFLIRSTETDCECDLLYYQYRFTCDVIFALFLIEAKGWWFAINEYEYYWTAITLILMMEAFHKWVPVSCIRLSDRIANLRGWIMTRECV